MPLEMPKFPGGGMPKMQLPPINKNTQTSIVEIVLLVVIVGLFYWFVVSPKKAEVSSAQDKLASLQTELAKVHSQKMDLEKGIKAMKSDPASIARLNESLPFDGKTMVLQELVEKFASEAGVVINTVSFAAPSDAPIAGDRELLKAPFDPKRNLKKITGNVSTKGQLSQIQNFLQKIESSARFFDVGDMQVVANPTGDIQLSVTLTTYYFAP